MPGPLAEQLLALADTLDRNQRQLVMVAAQFADSCEWVLAGAPNPASWLAEACGVEVCTTREWIRIGRRLLELPVIADAYASGALSYSKVRTLTRVSTLENERELVDLAVPIPEDADALHSLLTDGPGTIDTEIVLHVRGDGATCDDGTPIPDTVIADLAPDAFIRALVHDADGRPINASARQRHPTARQKRVMKERDRVCIDCGRAELLEYDHDPAFEASRRTVVDELDLRCAPCHQRRHRQNVA